MTDFVTCAQTNMILNDGVTIKNGYLTVVDGKIYQNVSTDPNNNIPFKKKPALLRNRVEFVNVVEVGETDVPNLQGKSFKDQQAFNDYLVSISDIDS